MDWLQSNYPKATTLDDYGMYGRDFPPATIEYVHAHWTREGDVYTKPVSVSKPIPVSSVSKPVSLPKILTPEQAEARANLDGSLVSDKSLNKVALDVLLNKGPDQAADFMMSSAGGDYARMRMMYG
jgi:hypothetical protein